MDNDTMTINGEEWVRKSTIPVAKYPAQNTDGMPFVICRGYYCGVHAGYLKEHDGNHCHLINSRRLWSWKAKEGISLSAVALYGISAGIPLPDELADIWLGDVYEIIPCTEEAARTIREAARREQN